VYKIKLISGENDPLSRSLHILIIEYVLQIIIKLSIEHFVVIGQYECVAENKIGSAYSELATLHVRSEFQLSYCQ